MSVLVLRFRRKGLVFKQMKYGYARGWEAVQYIENVKQYYDIISFLEEKDNKTDNKILNEVPKTL